MQLIFALCALGAQSDLKQVVAAITICEMQLNLIFLFLLTNCGFFYWAYFFLAHAINTSFGFWLVDDITKLYRTRNISYISGIAYGNKELARYVVAYILCISGFPGTLVF
jgi:NADH:ubiquinone oxidoreductase subunit 4 (subunit M)